MRGLAAAVLVLATLLLLAACGGGDDGEEGLGTTSLPAEQLLETATVDTGAAAPPTEPLPRVQVGQGESLVEGDSGDQVTALQNALVALGFDPGPVDGSFGPGTRAAVVAFQTRHSLPDDGIVGPETARIINQELGGAG